MILINLEKILLQIKVYLHVFACTKGAYHRGVGGGGGRCQYFLAQKLNSEKNNVRKSGDFRPLVNN